MAITGNKGEWSEMYTFLKLLGDGKVYAGDQNLNKIQNLFYPIIMILREERNGHFNYIPEGQNIVIQTPEGENLLKLPVSIFLKKASHLLEEIKTNKGAFSVPKIEDFMKEIYCSSLKAKSTSKADIRIVLHDRRTKINSEMGFSIKSQLGHPSTILNASKATNFNFKIEGVTLSEDDINEINSINPKREKVIRRVKEIEARGGHLVFDKMANPIFENNLIMLDRDLPQIIATLLLEQITSGKSSLKDLTEIISKKNPLAYNNSLNHPFYEYKIKHMLTSTALGMIPAKTWHGKYDANGGYLVVKSDGEIVCYHFFDRNRFEDYLFNNTYLERSSTDRHKYAIITKKEDNTPIFNLNFQIRLK